MGIEINNVPEESHYVITVDGERAGVAEYRIDGDAIVFTHTEVDPSHRDEGLASKLVRAALDDVRDGSQRRLVAECPYVRHWLGEHPEYNDLLHR
jgi:hypothetical protein